MLLNGVSELIRIVTTAASDLDVYAVWADQTASAFTPGDTPTAITTAATTTVVAAPAASTQRQVKMLMARNTDAVDAQTVTIEHYNGAIGSELWKGTLQPGEAVQFTWDAGFTRINSTGFPVSPAVAAVGVSVTLLSADDFIAIGMLL
jgi:hypothetical protein